MNKVILVIVVAMLSSSCATIVSHSSSIVGVDTTPQGATVQIIDRKGQTIYKGQTPATLSLKHGSGFFKKASYTVKLTLNGYQPREVTIDAHVNGWYWGNLLFGGVLGFLVIDPATGAMYKLNNVLVDEKLIPGGTSGTMALPGANMLKIVALKDIPAEWRKDLVKLP